MEGDAPDLAPAKNPYNFSGKTKPKKRSQFGQHSKKNSITWQNYRAIEDVPPLATEIEDKGGMILPYGVMKIGGKLVGFGAETSSWKRQKGSMTKRRSLLLNCWGKKRRRGKPMRII